VNWRHRVICVQRNIVRGQVTTPKNHQRRRIDLPHQLRGVLRLWRQQQRRAWLKIGKPLPDSVLASVMWRVMVDAVAAYLGDGEALTESDRRLARALLRRES